MADLQTYIEMSRTIPSRTRGEDAEALARVSLSLGADAVIVEIGAFLGCCTVLLAGPRKLQGSGKVHSVDPFDCSGDAFSVPYYQAILHSLGGGSLEEHFRANIRRCGLSDWVAVHRRRATDVAANWTTPIDLLLLDGDRSPQGARQAYESWMGFLKPGGVIVLRNTRPREYAEGHDGHRRLVLEEIIAPAFEEIRQVGAMTFARRASEALPQPRRRARGPMRVHLYAQCWNDEFMLPFFFRHYDGFVDRYVIYDDGSTDQSLPILARHPRVELRRFLPACPESFALSEQALSNECWKESRGEADWVIVTDLDEHLYHPAMRQYLEQASAAGITMIPALGFQMISNDLPRDAEVLCETYPFGAPWKLLMKPSIFNPAEIAEINFTPGRHEADPVGNICVPARDELLLLHYKYLNMARTHQRQAVLKSGLGAIDFANNFGYQYSWSFDDLKKDWEDVLSHAVEVRQFASAAAPPYPLERWWERFRRQTNDERAESAGEAHVVL